MNAASVSVFTNCGGQLQNVPQRSCLWCSWPRAVPSHSEEGWPGRQRDTVEMAVVAAEAGSRMTLWLLGAPSLGPLAPGGRQLPCREDSPAGR